MLHVSKMMSLYMFIGLSENGFSEKLEHSGAARKEGEKLWYCDYMLLVWQVLLLLCP